MTETTAEQQQAPAKSSRRIWGWGLFAFLTLGVAITAAVGAWYVRQDAEEDRARLLATLDEMTVQLTELEKLRDTQAAITLHQDESASVLASIATRMEKIELQQSRLANLVEGGRRHWQVVEIEQLMLIANDRLVLQHDIDGALHALAIANQRLRDIAEPRLLETRRILAEEISALRAVPDTDIQAMTLQLSALVARSMDLPLATDLPRNFENVAVGAEPEPSDATGWRRLLANLLNAVKGMLQIREVDRPLVPLLPPNQEFFLRQNLMLKLEAARLALLQRDTPSYRTSLDAANGWLRAFYSTGDSAVQSAIEEITELGRQDLRWEHPDIARSLQALRQYMAVSGTSMPAETGEQ